MHGFGHRGTLKHYPRLGIYKASNVTLDPKELQAYSYDWWRFLTRVGTTLVFNDFKYSVSTRRHQHKVLNTLKEMGIEPDLMVSTKLSLSRESWIDDAKTHALETLKEVRAKASRARSDGMKVYWLNQAIEQTKRIDGIERLLRTP